MYAFCNGLPAAQVAQRNVNRAKICRAPKTARTAVIRMNAEKVKDYCVTLCPYFKIKEENKAEFMECVSKFFELASTETKQMFYGFTFTDDGMRAHCREGYISAQGLLDHLDSVLETFGKALTFADLERLECHAPPGDIAILKDYEVLKDAGCLFYTLDDRSYRNE